MTTVYLCNIVYFQAVSVDIVSDRDGFLWKGHDPLDLRGGAVSMTPGFQVSI